MVTVQNSFGEALEAIRERHKMSRADFARSIQSDRSGYYAVISDKHHPGIGFVEQLLQLDSLTKDEERSVLEAFLQEQLERVKPKQKFKVKLR